MGNLTTLVQEQLDFMNRYASPVNEAKSFSNWDKLAFMVIVALLFSIIYWVCTIDEGEEMV